MNLLIVGGLLALGVLALVGAIFLALSEQRATTARNKSIELPASPARNDQATHKAIENPTMVQPNRPVADETTLASTASERHLPALNGQFHKVVGEIRTLHQQARQLEQRLSVLTEMVDRIESSQSSHTSIEEEAYPGHDNTHA
ncbi:MAG: hypothetical protein NVSMB33_03510 [Ktedonobacteraceae bacterium]